MRVAAITALLLLSLAAAWGARPPFDEKWQKVVVIWDFRKNDLTCHDEKAQLVGEEEPEIVVGTDAQGNAIRAKFRLLTFNCQEGKHVMRIWVDHGMDLIREVSCHGTRVCESKGYDDDEKATKVHCPEGPEGHDLFLRGSEREAK